MVDLPCLLIATEPGWIPVSLDPPQVTQPEPNPPKLPPSPLLLNTLARVQLQQPGIHPEGVGGVGKRN